MRLVSLRLVCVQPFDSSPNQHFAQLRIQILGKIGVLGRTRGSAADGANRPVGIPRHALELVQNRSQVAFGGR